jgi:hypothetical protein
MNPDFEMNIKVSKEWSWNSVIGLVAWNLGLRKENCNLRGKIVRTNDLNTECRYTLKIEKNSNLFIWW